MSTTRIELFKMIIVRASLAVGSLKRGYEGTYQQQLKRIIALCDRLLNDEELL